MTLTMGVKTEGYAMQQQDQKALMNFDFLARSFALMQAHGQQVDIYAVTGNMDVQQQAWFLERYEYYRQQMVAAKMVAEEAS